MRMQQIAILYPESDRVPEIKSWLSPYSAVAHVVSFTSLAQAVPILSKFPCDLMIAADRFPEARGASLLKGLRKLCPKSQFLFLASEDNTVADLAAISKNDMNVRYFPQPWDKPSLLAHVEAAVGGEAPRFATAMTLDDDQAQRLGGALANLLEETGALSIYLVTDLGQVLDYKGAELEQIGEVSSLLGGSFAALEQLGTTLGEEGDASNLIHRQGKTEDLYALSVGHQAVLLLRFAVGPNAPRIGTVAFYARQTVTELAAILAESPKSSGKSFATSDVETTIASELDRLFTDAEGERPLKGAKSGALLSLTEAYERGLVSKSLASRWTSSAEGEQLMNRNGEA